MAGESEIPVFVGRHGNHVIVRPQGPCTVGICDTLHEFLKLLPSSDTSELVFDMSQADWIDSTFTGLLVSLATGRGPGRVARVHLLNLGQKARGCLETMHVLVLFHLCEGLEEEPASWELLPSIRQPDHERARFIIQAHEALVAADRRNASVFQPIVDAFRAHQPSEPEQPR